MKMEQAIAEYMQYLGIKRFDIKTLKNHRNKLLIFCENIPGGTKTVLSSITYKDVEKFLTSERIRKLARGTFNQYISVFKKFFWYFHSIGTIPVNPAMTLEFVREEQKIIKYFTLEQLRLLLHTKYVYRSGARLEYQQRDEILMHLGGLCGLRSSEARKLTWADINFEYKELTVRKGKNLKDRIVPLPSQTYKLLKQEHKRKKPHQNDYVLYGFWGKPMNHQIVNSVIKRLTKQAGIEIAEPHFHMLRHTCATIYLRGKPKERGMDIRVVKELLGHANISTTQKYTHVDKQFLAEEMRRCLPKLALG